ncbi:MAG: putative metallopeptidase secreted [Frankiales bacterium]|nr:putative metallopeptidase secreted [Frankiales bacterium]
MGILKPLAVTGVVIALSVGLAPGVSANRAPAFAPSPGSAGAGDPYFPLQGNGGYQALHYDLDIDYQPSVQHLSGAATIRAVATQDLSRFDLDLRRNLVVSAVTVNGRRAAFTQPAALSQELVITPPSALHRGLPFVVSVRYAGHAEAVTDPDGSPDGFIPTSDGAFVASEPQGAPSWFPANDTPTDKATFSVSITVPAGLTAVSNGTRVASWTAGGQAHSTWLMGDPISTYLVTATIGRFSVTTGRTGRGVPYLIAVDPTQAAESKPVLASLPSMVDFFASVYGPYPFTSAGAIVDDAPEVGYALETATRPVFDRAPDVQTLSHELAHQWFGDSVTLSRWRDIWLNEGFAEFSSWLWDEHAGIETAAAHLQDLLSEPADSDVWDPPPSNPGSAADIFDSSIYERGAGALEALRERLGDQVFFTIMRGWARTNRGGNATVDDFRAYAAAVSHRNLNSFFATWLDQPGKPVS